MRTINHKREKYNWTVEVFSLGIVGTWVHNQLRKGDELPSSLELKVKKVGEMWLPWNRPYDLWVRYTLHVEKNSYLSDYSLKLCLISHQLKCYILAHSMQVAGPIGKVTIFKSNFLALSHSYTFTIQFQYHAATKEVQILYYAYLISEQSWLMTTPTTGRQLQGTKNDLAHSLKSWNLKTHIASKNGWSDIHYAVP